MGSVATLDRSRYYLNTGMRVSGAQSASRRSVAAFRELLSALLLFSFWIFFIFVLCSFFFVFTFVLVFVNESHTACVFCERLTCDCCYHIKCAEGNYAAMSETMRPKFYTLQRILLPRPM